MGGVGISGGRADSGRRWWTDPRTEVTAVEKPQGREHSWELGAQWGFGNSPRPRPPAQPGAGSVMGVTRQVRLREFPDPRWRPQTTLWGGLRRGDASRSRNWLQGPCSHPQAAGPGPPDSWDPVCPASAWRDPDWHHWGPLNPPGSSRRH